MVPMRQSLTSEENYLSIVLMVGRTFSLAERETKKEKGTNQRQIVKYAITLKHCMIKQTSTDI